MSAPWTTKRAEWIVLVILVALTATATAQKAKSDGGVNVTDEIDDFVPYQGERFSIFDWNIFQHMARAQRGNLLISPISLKLALVLLYEGAQDETAHELASVMVLPVSRSATRDRFSNILKSLQVKRPEYSLNVGTRIFIDDTIVPRQRYGAIAKSFYNTDVVNTNFSDVQPSADTINNFVKNITDGRINQIVDDAAKLKDSLMVIVNAIFFKGTWHRHPFSINDTKINKFYMSDMKTVLDVPFMRASSKFYLVYAEELNAKILRLPYAGHKYAMYMVLPQTLGKLDEVITQITPFIINRHVWLMQEVHADVIIPKFKFEFTSHLEDTLRQMGIRDIFDDTATLTGILRSKSTSRRLIVTDIIQKAGIEVNEKGTVAYAATEIEIGNKMNDETFLANQPFLFYIEEESTGTILYMGVVNNPLEETGIVEAPPQPQQRPTPQPPLSTQPPPPSSLPSSTWSPTPLPPSTLTPQQPQQQQQTPTDPQMPPRVGEHVDSNGTAVDAGPSIGRIDGRENFFNIELLQELNDVKPGNVIVGTASVKAAIMILAEAAAGKTRQQIISTLRLPSDPAGIRAVAALSISPFKDQATELETAIKLWLSKDVPLTKNFSDILQRYYKGELQGTDFNDVFATAGIINDWVKKYTHGHITSLVEPSSLAPDTRMLLTTAVYFKGKWLNAFDKTATRTRCFRVSQFGCVDVPMMETVANYKYAEVPSLDAQVVQIPYTGGRVSMLVFLPKRFGEHGLRDLSRDLAFTPLSSILSSLQDTELLLQLPRFSANNKMDLRAVLEKLGIRDLFYKEANLTAAFPRGNVMVSEVLHSAQIEVSEEGTIAASVTGAAVIPLMGSTTTTFRADRPFIYFLLDHKINCIIFAGRFVQPEKTTLPRAA